MNDVILIGLAGVLAAAAPVLFAAIGETISERAGVINLSVNGTILLTAMAGFAVSVSTGSLLLGCLAVAWGICWLTGRKAPADSIWFGRATVDGVFTRGHFARAV